MQRSTFCKAYQRTQVWWGGCPKTVLFTSVPPGEVFRVPIVRRPHLKDAGSAKKQKRYLEVFFTTTLRLPPVQILEEYQGRWSVEILIREAKERFGLGEDRCRNTRKISGINNFRLLIGAIEALYVAETQESERPASEGEDRPNREAPPGRFDELRPWYKDPGVPNLFDIHWSVREGLADAGITPKVGRSATPGESEQKQASDQPQAV